MQLGDCNLMLTEKLTDQLMSHVENHIFFLINSAALEIQYCITHKCVESYCRGALKALVAAVIFNGISTLGEQ
jgi:hypothetical protein